MGGRAAPIPLTSSPHRKPCSNSASRSCASICEITARRLLRIEHALAAAVDVVDRHGALPIVLRTSSFVHALIRLLATRAARVDAPRLEAPALAGALGAAIARVAIPGTDETVLTELAGCLRSVALRGPEGVGDAGPPPLPPGWTPLLECRSGGRYVDLRYRLAADRTGELELVTEADGARLAVAIEGSLPDPGLLARLT
jgi:hypothetical protein